jgi:hypothetical protein
MKKVSNQTEHRIALVLFPFKVYVAMAFPFLILCQLLHGLVRSQFYGDPDGAQIAVFIGNAISVIVLLPGALLQAMICRRGSAIRTRAFLAAGILMPLLYVLGLTLRR